MTTSHEAVEQPQFPGGAAHREPRRGRAHRRDLRGATTIPAPTALLIRPDGYVGWVSDGAPDLADLRETLTTWCRAADRRSHKDRVVP